MALKRVIVSVNNTWSAMRETDKNACPISLGKSPKHETLPGYPGGVNFTEQKNGLEMEKGGNKTPPNLPVFPYPWMMPVCVLVAKLCLTFVTPWTVACQAALSIEFFRQK